ncbi:hypothetical protein ABZ619_39155 [Streptomyces sp. NPDC007851]|uniref:hypothetical protein n=1 Tax=Streptomyces sp. NPDC007851 TaxID=3155008 RepID=UPI0034046E9A
MTTANHPALRAAKTRHERRTRRLKAYGQWDPWRPAEPVRAYVKQLMDSGLAAHRIATGSGVEPGLMRHLLYGDYRYGVAKKIRKENAELIMAFRPTLDDYTPTSVISSIGSRRRLQALATLGWTLRALAPRCRLSEGQLAYVMQSPTTSAAVAVTIRDLYNELWHRSPDESEVKGYITRRAKTIAARSGWHGPLAWDDDTIDDPKVRPRRGRKDDGGVDMAKVMRRLEGENLPLSGWENTAAIEYGARTRGLSFDAIAELLAMDLDSVKRTWERIKERARADGEKWPNAPQWTDPRLTQPTDFRRAA